MKTQYQHGRNRDIQNEVILADHANNSSNSSKKDLQIIYLLQQSCFVQKIIAIQLTKTKSQKVKKSVLLIVGTIMHYIKLEISMSKCRNCGIKTNKNN